MTGIRGVSVILCFTGVFSLIACSTNKDHNKQQAQPVPAASNLDTLATSRFTALLRDYYRLKDALVHTSSQEADEAASAMAGQITAIRAAADTSQTSQAALSQLLDTLAYNLDRIRSIKDESCETKRIYFQPVSESLYDALKLIQLQHVTVYHIFCPMAFREEGAFWLSNDPEIKNPYFGAKMIECGEVIDTLQ